MWPPHHSTWPIVSIQPPLLAVEGRHPQYRNCSDRRTQFVQLNSAWVSSFILRHFLPDLTEWVILDKGWSDSEYPSSLHTAIMKLINTQWCLVINSTVGYIIRADSRSVSMASSQQAAVQSLNLFQLICWKQTVGIR